MEGEIGSRYVVVIGDNNLLSRGHIKRIFIFFSPRGLMLNFRFHMGLLSSIVCWNGI